MKQEKTISEKIWQFFCSVKLTVYTLVLLALTSIIGTVILQNGTQEEYIRLYGEVFYKLIRFLQIDDMYSAWWFIGLMIVLCINIIVCSVERISNTWKIIFPKKLTFNPERFRKQKNIESFSLSQPSDTVLKKCETFLTGSIGKVLKEEKDGSVCLYSEKRRWTRLGVYVVHSSILLLLAGALIGVMFGFKANLNLEEGKSSDKAFIFSQKKAVDMGFTLKCNRFEVKFYDTGAPEEFKSNLTVIENGKESFTRDILVNKPLRYRGINIFQASYGPAQPDSVTMDIIRQEDKSVTQVDIKTGQEVDLPGGKGVFKLEGFIPHFEFRGHNIGEAFVGRVSLKDQESFQIGIPVKFPSFDKMRKGEFAFVVKDFQKKYYTGLQITRDPGVWYVYAGFVLMIIGCWITFFMSHDSYMIEISMKSGKNTSVSVSGITNRNSQGMKLKIKKMVLKLKGE